MAEPLEEREWFCPHCGLLTVRLRCEADQYATDVITADGDCAFCGHSCCSKSELTSLLQKAGLDLCTAAERKVLEALPIVAAQLPAPESLRADKRISLEAKHALADLVLLARRGGTSG